MELIGIKGVAILLFVLVAMFNASRAIQRTLHFNRPMPIVDASSLGLLLIGGLLFSLQGLLEFRAADYLSEFMAYVLSILVGISTAWQATRQR